MKQKDFQKIGMEFLSLQINEKFKEGFDLNFEVFIKF